MSRKPDWTSEDGTVRLFKGDALALLPDPQEAYYDCVITDPPYGIGLRNGDVDGHRSPRSFTIAGDADQVSGLTVLDWAERSGLPTIAFASPWKPWPGKWRNLIAWDKGGAVGGGGDIATCLKRTWELIQVARTSAMNGPRDGSVWRYPMVPADTRLHICKKPVALMAALIERFTNPGNCIFDPFMGSGSTGEACIETGRHFVGVEIDDGHFDTAVSRIEAAISARDSKLFTEVPA